MAATESKGGIGFGSLFDAIKTTKQEYQKEQKAEPSKPAAPATDLFSALSATKQEYEKQKTTQAMGDISQEAKLRETLVAGVPEVVAFLQVLLCGWLVGVFYEALDGVDGLGFALR